MIQDEELKAYSAIVRILVKEFSKFYSNCYKEDTEASEFQFNSQALLTSRAYKNKLEELIVLNIEKAAKIRYNETLTIITQKMYKNPLELDHYINKLKSKAYDQFMNSNLSNRLAYIENVLFSETLKYRTNRGTIRYKDMLKEFRFLTPIANLSARLLFSEVKRLEREITLLMCRDSEVEFLRWTSSGRNLKRTKDVCDEYMNNQDSTIKGTNTLGMFRIDEYPEYPHPNCNCKIEII